jgi:SOS-response transcriptional repressor LexA
MWDPALFISLHSYYRSIHLPSSSTYSVIQTLAASSWLSLQTNFTSVGDLVLVLPSSDASGGDVHVALLEKVSWR